MDQSNQDQAEYWGSSPSGAKWLTFEDRLDAALAPVLDLVLDRAALQDGEHVLDIGCGTGASLIAASAMVGASGSVLGADIAEQLLARAEDRITASGAGNIKTVLADAQDFAFEPKARDALISRFGVMFFADPVAAFHNMAKGLRPGGQMTFAAWGPLGGNPWFWVPHLKAVAHLGPVPKTDRNAPGPLAFHDADRVIRLLQDSGLVDVTVDAVDVDLTPMGGLDGAADLVMQVGSAVRALTHHNGTAEDAATIRDAVRAEFQAYERADKMVIPALINLFQARVPG